MFHPRSKIDKTGQGRTGQDKVLIYDKSQPRSDKKGQEYDDLTTKITDHIVNSTMAPIEYTQIMSFIAHLQV